MSNQKHKFYHRCNKMPEDFHLYQFADGPSNFYIHRYSGKEVSMSTIVYDINYCPYCGEPTSDMVGTRDDYGYIEDINEV